MGLFDFARNIGNKLFDRDEEAAKKIKEEVESCIPGTELTSVTYDDGVVTMAGTCIKPGHREAAVLIAGNVKGVERVVAEGLVAPEPVEKVEYYIVERGDSLSKIAKRFYGDPMTYPRIFEANREIIKNADLIFPGQKIRIPLD